jgi:hypothetical protein
MREHGTLIYLPDKENSEVMGPTQITLDYNYGDLDPKLAEFLIRVYPYSNIRNPFSRTVARLNRAQRFKETQRELEGLNLAPRDSDDNLNMTPDELNDWVNLLGPEWKAA